MTPPTRLERLFAEAAAMNANVFLVVDGWQGALTRQVRAASEGWEPLMGPGRREREIACPPLLVDLALRSDVLEPWFADDFRDRLGIVVVTPLGRDEVRASLERFLTLLDPDDRRIGLRFWNAQTLSCFLHSGYPSQWASIFDGIAFIAAPSGHGDRLSFYRCNDHRLSLGTEDDGDSIAWHAIDARHPDAHHDDAPSHLRKIHRRQYDEMEACARLSFHEGILALLQRSFPDAAAGSREDLLGLIERADKAAVAHGYGSGDCIRYWAVLSVMGGERFYEETATALYLQIRFLSPETRLERLIDEANKALALKSLRELTDVWETCERYE